MSVFRQIRDWLRSDEDGKARPRTERHPGKEARPRRTTTIQRRPKREQTPWWEAIPERTEPRESHRLEGPLAAQVKRIAMRVHTGRLPCPEPAGEEKAFLHAALHEEVTPDVLARLYAAHPALNGAASLATLGEPLASVPSGEAGWRKALASFSPEEVALATMHRFGARWRRELLGADHPALEDLDEHALAAGVAALHLGGTLHVQRPLLLVLAALTHDLGRAAVRAVIREESSEACELEAPARAWLVRTLHEEAGLALARRMELPDPVAQVLGSHHTELAADDRFANLKALVRLADEAAIRCGHGGGELPRERVGLIETPPAVFLKLPAERGEALFGPIPSRIVRTMLRGL